jgi:hypothetical protein
MPTFLQQVDFPERCFLKEVLYWVAFQRLPLAFYNEDGHESRETEEIGDYAVDLRELPLSEDETARIGIPPDPDWLDLTGNSEYIHSLSFIDSLLAKSDLDAEARKSLEAERERSVKQNKEITTWLALYNRAIEYPASRIFVALRSGSLRARGRLLPAASLDAARSIIEKGRGTVFDIPISDVPPTFWSLQGINFDTSAAGNGTAYYCHISCRTDYAISLFPGEREEVGGVIKVGDSFILGEKPDLVRPNLRRGRPPYNWDGFHLELAALLHRDELPEKKEAAIEYFRDWFDREHGIKVSRSVVGEKLKPYYDKFIRERADRKSKS